MQKKNKITSGTSRKGSELKTKKKQYTNKKYIIFWGFTLAPGLQAQCLNVYSSSVYNFLYDENNK